MRSMPAPQLSCTFGYGEQMNQITHFLDGSMVYGSDKQDGAELRQSRGGRMKTHGDGKGLLPQEEKTSGGEECQIQDRGRKCFKAGDSRSNEQPGLTVYHTVWVREHNRWVIQ